MIKTTHYYSYPSPKRIAFKKLPNHQCDCGRYMEIHIQNVRSGWDIPENYLWWQCDFCDYEASMKACEESKKALAQIKKTRTKKVIQKSDTKVSK